MNRKLETKYIGQYTTTTAAQTGVAPFNPGVWENAIQPVGSSVGGQQYWSVALPAMTQAAIASGVAASDITRIGNYIEPVAHRVKMTVRLAPQSIGGEPPAFQASYNPLDLTVYVFYGYIKALKTYGASGNTSLQGQSIVVSGQTEATRAMRNLLDDGDLSFSTFTGDPILAQQPLSSFVNMKVKKLHFRRGVGWINSNLGVGTSGPPNAAADNTISRQITLKFKPPTKLHYVTQTDLYPDNYAPVYAVGYVFNDPIASTNTTAPDYGEGQVQYVAQSQLWYKDT